MSFKQDINRHLSNLPGWRTRRKIIVVESDDWGSIRMSSGKAFENLKNAGIRVDKSHYNSNDGLESNDDLEMLFEVLTRYRDKTGRPVVFTGVNVVANPDFVKIREHNFEKYFFEPYTETAKCYPSHDRIYELWKEGNKKRIFVPVFHGREHLNVLLWLRALQRGCKSTLLAFENGVTGISRGINGEYLGDYQAAFDVITATDLKYQEEVLKSGIALFEKLYGFNPVFFIPTNGPFNNTLEPVAKELGICYIGTGKIQMEPLGDGRYKKHYRYLGKKNRWGQIYLTRNCFFEPNSWEHSLTKDWVNDCLHEIDIAFKWHKPATISSHRTNYIGWLRPQNRDNGLKKLDQLLSAVLKRWPDVEFMTSVELGELIRASEKN